MSKGTFIVLEGIDGSGTTTQLRLLSQALRTRGHVVHETAEPTEGPIGQQIRSMLGGSNTPPPAALALLFAADRVDHLHREIEPALHRGEVVLCDRYLVSSLAYQGLDCPPPWLRRINAQARQPDLTLLVAVSSTLARRRVSRRLVHGGAEEIFDHDDVQRRIADAYESLARDPALGVTVVDGSGRIEDVFTCLLSHCERIGL